MNTIEESLKEAISHLHALPNPKREAELLLALAMQRNRSYLIAFPERTLSTQEAKIYHQLIQQRAQGVPYAYLAGSREFYGLTLTVTEDTLIPRDDTEIIVDRALDRIPESADASFRLLDMGTGTGAIALAIASMRPNISITALDYSPKTLAIAKLNAQQNGLSLQLLESDWFSALDPQSPFDLILSNPPYIDPNDHHLNNDGIRYEPMSALVAEESGYADLLHLIDQAPHYLKADGALLLEHGYDQALRLRQAFCDRGYHAVESYRDYGNHERVTTGTYTP